MKIYRTSCLLILIFWTSHSKAGNPEVSFVRQAGEPIEGIRIAWDYSSMQKLAPAGQRVARWAGYPRVRRLKDGTLMGVYDIDGNGEMIASKDQGKTWSKPVATFQKHPYANAKGESTMVNIANSELCQLQNGDLIMACNYRPAKNEIAPFAIAIRRSPDMGHTWTEDQVIFEAHPRFTDGCWEPSFLQLPNGELQVYFANEAPFTASDEQNISMLSSWDSGKTWSKEAKPVSFRATRRDGMPVALLVDDEIVVSIEDNHIGQFKPFIVRTNISDNWNTPVLADSPNREYALKDQLPEEVYAGAPYLMRVPSGEVILSYQTTSGRTSNWELSTFEVAIGDAKGRRFEKLSRPFDIPLDREGKWNSISLWDEHTIVAATTTSFRNVGCEVWMILGHIIPEMKALHKTVTVDGICSTAEWGENLPLFVGHQSETNLSAAVCHDEKNLYVGVSVKDSERYADPLDPLKSDGVNLYVDAGNYKLLSPDKGLFKIWCNAKGESRIYQGNKGQWKELKADKLRVRVKPNGQAGYQIEFKVPYSVLAKHDKSPVRLNLGLVDYSSPTSFYEETIVHSTATESNTWVKVTLN